MRLKRHFKIPAGWVAQYNTRNAAGQLIAPGLKEGDCLNPPPLDFVEVYDTGATPQQNFSADKLLGYLREGWASFVDGDLHLAVEIDGSPETLRYKVIRAPGYHCRHCDWSKAGDEDDRGDAARAHVKSAHPQVALPDSYERIHCFECVLDPAQHQKYKALPIGVKSTEAAHG